MYSSFSEGGDMNDCRHQQNMKLEIQHKFNSPTQFRQFIRECGSLNGYDLKWPKEGGGRIIVMCKAKSMPI